MEIRGEVLIVGGGPTGWMAACELALAGVRVAVIERRAEPIRESRALTLHPRSLEIFSMRGLLSRALEKGRPVPVGHYGMLDTRLDFSALDTRCPYTLFLPQALTERLLEQRAIELGVEIRRGHRVERVEQDPEGVRLEGESEAGRFVATGRWLVGCDGARSVVRQQLGIESVGAPASMTTFLADLAIDRPPSPGPFGVANPRGRIVGVPLGPVYRLIFLDPERASTPVDQPVTLDELRDSVRRIADADWGLRDPTWMSRFGDECRLAGRYRQGRAFLAGDAAHVHFPAGGQGLNVGLQDAFNLSWKLAGVVRGLGPESLLDSYHPERHPVGGALIENTLSQGALMWAGEPRSWALRTLLGQMLRIPEANRMLAEQASAFDVRYPDPLWPFADAPPSPLVGRRLCDLDLPLADGSRTTLYVLCAGGRWLELRSDDGPPLSSALPEGWVDRIRLAPGGLPEGASALVLRPDGHVAASRLRAAVS